MSAGIWGSLCDRPFRTALADAFPTPPAHAKAIKKGHGSGSLVGLGEQLLAPRQLQRDPTRARSLASQELVVQAVSINRQLLHQRSCGKPRLGQFGAGRLAHAHDDAALVGAAHHLPDLRGGRAAHRRRSSAGNSGAGHIGGGGTVGRGGGAFGAGPRRSSEPLVDIRHGRRISCDEGMAPPEVQLGLAEATDAPGQVLHKLGWCYVVLGAAADEDLHSSKLRDLLPSVVGFSRLQLPRHTLPAEWHVEAHLLVAGEQGHAHLPLRVALLLPLLRPLNVCLEDFPGNPLLHRHSGSVPVVDREGRAALAAGRAAAQHQPLDKLRVAERQVLRDHAAERVAEHIHRQFLGYDRLKQRSRIVGIVLHGARLILDGRLPGVSVVEGQDLEHGHALVDILLVGGLAQVCRRT
mmetsp:Transcript_69858/g.226603  ORF Transcript_69858/g.226603 Transcript_69858/m.226603 type:complete len:408 (+) Transcript_69858:2-1225(+)